MENDKVEREASYGQAPDALMELASLSPAAAMLAANALVRSPSQSTREKGASLGLAAIAGGGAGFGAEVLTFAASMLSNSSEMAMSFVLAAPSVARRLASELLLVVDADRCMEIEAVLPGFASLARAGSLAQRPALVGLLSVAGKISPELRRSVMSEAAEACARELIHATSRGGGKRRSTESLAIADSFAEIVSSICPEWERECWSDFWSVELRESLGQASTARWREWQTLPSAFNPFSVAPAPQSLSLGQKELAMSWCHAFGGVERLLPCADRARDLGRYLASAPEGWTPWREREMAFPLRLLGDGGPFPALTACNASAEALTIMAPPASLARKPANFLSEKTKCWLALAEGLIEGGASPPKFKMRDRGEACIKNIFPDDMPLSLSLLFVLGVAAPIEGAGAEAFFSWIAQGADPREAGRLQKLGASWRPGRDSSPVNLDETQARALTASLVMLDRCEISMASEFKALAGVEKSSPSIRL